MCIDVVHIWFGIAKGQILPILVGNYGLMYFFI